MANFEVLSLDPTTPQIRAPGAGDGYSVPRDMTFATGTTLNAPTTVVSVNTSTDALRITQVGAGNALLVEDSANPDASPTAITATGAVGIGTATPSTVLHVKGTVGGTDPTVVTGERVRIQSNDTTGRSAYMSLIAGTAANSGVLFGDQDAADVGQIRYLHSDNSMQFYTSSAEQMRLTSTGLGIGTTSPVVKFHVRDTTDYNFWVRKNGSTVQLAAATDAFAITVPMAFSAGSYSWAVNNGTNALNLDTSGNLGLGVTPSAWGSGKAIEVGSVGNSFWGTGATSNYLLQNAYHSGGAFRYASNNPASGYGQNSSNHYWFIAASGTAGNTITFTQAMTLDASGNLMVGATSAVGRFTLENAATTTEITLRSSGGVGTNNRARIIGGYESGGSDYGGYLAFNTTSSSNVNGERARITAVGEFLVGGTTALSQTMTLQGPVGATLGLFRDDVTVTSGNQIGAINFFGNDSTSNIPAAFAQVGAVASGTHDPGDNPTDIVFATTPDGTATVAEAGRITQAGSYVLKGGTTTAAAGVGIIFPATQVASANANSLDDYEEGAWTPTIEGSTAAGTATYVTQIGRYTKIGNLVVATASINYNTHTGTGDMRLAGLPFTALNVAAVQPSAAIGYIGNIALTANNVATAYVQQNTTYLNLVQTPVGGGAVNPVAMDAAGIIQYTVCYYV